MDANRLRPWLLANEEDWDLGGAVPAVRYDRERRSLRLTSRRRGVDDPGSKPPWTELDEPAASRRRERVPQALDVFGTRALWDETSRAVVSMGAGSYWDTETGAVVHLEGIQGEIPLFSVPAGNDPTDLAMGADGMLYLAIGNKVEILDLRVSPDEREGKVKSWRSRSVRAAGFKPWRLAPAPGGGVWALDRASRKLARLTGLALRELPGREFESATFRPDPENADPPTIRPVKGTVWPVDETAGGIACSADGRVALVSWRGQEEARLRLLGPNDELLGPWSLQWAKRPYSVAWVSEHRIAVLLALDEDPEGPGVPEAVVYDLADVLESMGHPRSSPSLSGRLPPVGETYPLREYDEGPFMNGVLRPPHYLGREGPTPLHPLSRPTFARRGWASNRGRIDSRDSATVWHRLYVEADVPAGCAVTAFLAATDENEPPRLTAMDAWYPHRFGGEEIAPGLDTPRAAWCGQPSEIPFHPGLLQCDPIAERAGLFTVLIQRAGRRVRDLRGRYLWVRLELEGNATTTPEVAAVRAYWPRFAYREHYLPALYREADFGPDRRDEDRRILVEPATPADFLGRFLGLFESVLTPLEDKVAGAYVITRPESAPPEALGWLGNWLGLSLDDHPEPQRRAMIGEAHRLARTRGTMRGLQLSLDIMTGGRVGERQVLVVEDFRLRRTFSTILGLDLADENDPLLAGLARSGNSYVGDTLFLGEATQKEFLALFSEDLRGADPRSESPEAEGREVGEEERAIRALFDDLAHRVTILVHRDLPAGEVDLVRRVAREHAPAHVRTRILPASAALIVGMTSLVGVDTYVGPGRRREALRLGESRLGREDFLQRPPSLDPRVEGDVP